MRIALDVNRYVDFCNRAPDAVETVRSADRVMFPFVVIAELRSGFRLGTQSERNERTLGGFLQKPRVDVLFADEVTTHFYASIYADLQRSGTPIPTNDIWIAALVIQHDLVLFSRDRHFDRLPRIPRI